MFFRHFPVTEVCTIYLYHCLFQSVFNGMHVIFIPYSLMKVDPASWMKMITKYKGTNDKTFNAFDIRSAKFKPQSQCG